MCLFENFPQNVFPNIRNIATSSYLDTHRCKSFNNLSLADNFWNGKGPPNTSPFPPNDFYHFSPSHTTIFLLLLGQKIFKLQTGDLHSLVQHGFFSVPPSLSDCINLNYDYEYELSSSSVSQSSMSQADQNRGYVTQFYITANSSQLWHWQHP